MSNIFTSKERLNKIVASVENIDNVDLFNKILFEYVYTYVCQKFNREDIAGDFCVDYIMPRSLNLVKAYKKDKKGEFSDYIDNLVNVVLDIVDEELK